MRVLESFARSWRAGSIWFAPCGPNARHQLISDGTGLFIDRAHAVLPMEVPMRRTDWNAGIWRLSLGADRVNGFRSSRTGTRRRQ